MLHQIALYRQIPELIKDVRGFREETQERLSGVASKDYRLSGKYRRRLEQADRALKVLRELHMFLDE